MTASLDGTPESITQTVQITSLRFTPAMVVAIIVAVGGGCGAYFSLKTEIESKASTMTVNALGTRVETNTSVLQTMRERQLRMYCGQFPQSFECPAQEP